jgi:hypothetical protein
MPATSRVHVHYSIGWTSSYEEGSSFFLRGGNRPDDGAQVPITLATLSERLKATPRELRVELWPSCLHSRCSSQQYLFVERANGDSFALREPNVEGVGPAKPACNGHAHRGARAPRSERDDFMGCAGEGIEDRVNVGLGDCLTRQRPGDFNKEERRHDNRIDSLEGSLHLRAGGCVKGFRHSRRGDGDRGIEDEAHYLAGSWRRRPNASSMLSDGGAQRARRSSRSLASLVVSGGADAVGMSAGAITAAGLPCLRMRMR